jgi:PBP1b-binding outer membrane lipoprotein LpoB
MKKNIFLIAIGILLLNACSQNEKSEANRSSERTISDESTTKESSSSTDFTASHEEMTAFSSPTSSSPKTYISSSAAVENSSDSARKIIRTADIKFKVDDVIQSTYKIEDIIVAQGGLVSHTDLESEINDVHRTMKNQDSDLVTTYYTITNTLTLRVPSAKLDTTLKQIAQFVDFMDYRIINARNVTLDLLAKKLEQNRLKKYNARMNNAIDNKGKRLDDISDAEENLLDKNRQFDEAKLNNLLLADSIQYSTINLSLYQNRSVKIETVAVEKIYKTPFGTRFVNALKFGWAIITEIFLFLINLWSIILLSVIIYFLVKYIRKKYFKK